MTRTQLVRDAIEAVGGQSILAQQLGVRQGTISKWLDSPHRLARLEHEHLTKLCEIVGVKRKDVVGTLDELLTENAELQLRLDIALEQVAEYKKLLTSAVQSKCAEGGAEGAPQQRRATGGRR